MSLSSGTLSPLVRALYTLTIFLSAGLLFLVEPMVARMILPNFGGSAQVWNTCLLFFQVVLLAGYGYAHLSTRWLGPGKQWILHVSLLFAASIYLWWHGFRAPTGAGSAAPEFALLGILLTLIGLPFFVVSAGSSVLQRWFSSTNDPDAKDPYFLYGASNFGSLLALLAYPLLLEPKLGLAGQAHLWTVGLWILTAAMGACGVALAIQTGIRPPVDAGGFVSAPYEFQRGRRSKETLVVEDAAEDPAAGQDSSGTNSPAPTPDITNMQRAKWTLFAAVPSSLLLGVTTYLSTNIAPIPLLWVVPLSLYLLSFILAFSRKPLLSVEILGRIVPLLVTPLAIALILESSEPLIPLAALHLSAFLFTAWMCHARLNASRPDPTHLTEFYFWLAVGGVLGGAFNALLAPVVFKTLLEYPIALVVAMCLRPMVRTSGSQRTGTQGPGSRRLDFLYPVAVGLLTLVITFAAKARGMDPSAIRTMVCIGLPAVLCYLAVDRPLRYGLSLAALILAANGAHVADDGVVILSERSFFGVHRVMSINKGRFHRLSHGNTIHGIQDLLNPRTPLTYYYPNGPIGQVFGVFHGPNKKHDVGLVGLGVGSLAAYGEPGQNMDFYEIDPVVKSIATNPKYFTFLRDSQANVRVIMGDARLSLQNAPDGRYGLLVLDAFSSDAIPVHLLTEEAFNLYLRKMRPDGVLCVHISNRFLDLSIVVGAIARDLHLVALDDEDAATPEEQDLGKQSSRWVFVARKKSDLQGVNRLGADTIQVLPTTPAWTDDFSNVLSVFKPGE